MNLNAIARARTLAALKLAEERALAQAKTYYDTQAIREAVRRARAMIERRKARARKRNRPARKGAKALCVALYDCNRAYGGPEEGGWWFDTGSLVSVEATFFNRDKAHAYCRNVAEPACTRANAGKRPIWSVLCDGVLTPQIESCPPPPYYPMERPHYE